MSTITERPPWRTSERERRLTAIFADAGIASSDALLALLATLYRHHPDDLAHVQRVAGIAVRIAGELGLSERETTDLEWAAWGHDLGKLVLPEAVGADDGAATPANIDRWTEQLVAAGAVLVAAPALRRAAAIVMASRECIDGSGFPNRLRGGAIPIGARILHVADTYDALQDLCSVLAMPIESVNVELARHAGSRFDTTVVAAWLRLVDEQSMQSLSRPGERAGSTV
jgi:response regulator RpfG family c-di-GMP phosphodiesterase